MPKCAFCSGHNTKKIHWMKVIEHESAEPEKKLQPVDLLNSTFYYYYYIPIIALINSMNCLLLSFFLFFFTSSTAAALLSFSNCMKIVTHYDAIMLVMRDKIKSAASFDFLLPFICISLCPASLFVR